MARSATMGRFLLKDFGTCLDTGSFAGSVNCGTINLSNNPISIFAWVKFRQFQTSSPFISTIAGIETGTGEIALLRVGYTAASTNNFLCFSGNFSVGGNVNFNSSNTPLKTGIWYHVGATFDSSNLKLYINGVQELSTAQTGNIGANSTFRISLSNGGAGRQMNGLIDEVRVYKRALSSTEISDLYHNIEPSTTNLEGYWKLDEGSGSSATDSSGNGHTGTITSCTYSTDVFMKPRSAVTNRISTKNNVNSLLYNGTSDKIVTTLWSSATNTISMGGWFKSNDYTRTRQCIISNGNGAGGAERGFALILSGNSTTDGSMYLLNHVIAWIDLGFKVQDNNWHHIFMTRNGANLTKVYLDGVERYSASPTLNTPSTNSYIGYDNLTGYFKGYLDDMRFYTAGLTQAQVLEIYTRNSFFNPSVTPTNWYKFDEGSGTTANDSGSSVKNGTITGAAYSTTLPYSDGRVAIT